MTIKDILMGSDLLELKLLELTAVDRIDLGVEPLEKSVLYHSQSGEHIDGYILLARKHGIYDMVYFKQELKHCAESACFTFESITEGEMDLRFSLKPRDSIIVDTNTELIPLGNDTKMYDAKNLKSVSHYTTVKSAIGILSNGMLIAKSLSGYASEKNFALSENSRRLIFIVCFSLNQDDKDDMWEKFSNNHKGCKIDLFFRKSILEVFRLTEPLKCYTSSGEIYYIPFGIMSQHNGLNNKYLDMVHFSEYFYKVKYNDEFTNKSNLICYDPSVGTKNFTIVGEAGTYVQGKYKFQDEVRIMLMLHSTSRNEIPFIKKVELPFCFDHIDSIVITLGKNISLQNKMRLSNQVMELKEKYPKTNFCLRG